ncbi:MAG: hypothetical protein ACRD45_19500, partial [Bryobacteraceae bacterium]
MPEPVGRPFHNSRSGRSAASQTCSGIKPHSLGGGVQRHSHAVCPPRTKGVNEIYFPSIDQGNSGSDGG